MKLRFKGNPAAFPCLFLTICHFVVTTELPGADCVPAPSGMTAWWRAENNALDELGKRWHEPHQRSSHAARQILPTAQTLNSYTP